MKPKPVKKPVSVGRVIGGLIVVGGLSSCLALSGKMSEADEAEMIKKVFRPIYAVTEGAAHVVVWRDEAASDKGYKLLQAGIRGSDPMLFALTACLVDSGTRIITVKGGFFASTIAVTEGRNKGCEGYIPNEFISYDPKQKKH